MITPATTIWDTRIQNVCGIVSAQDGPEVDAWMCANFGQASLSPPRLIVNPNRMYPIEGAVRRAGRFALTVLPESGREAALRLTRLRRREPDKASRLGLPVVHDPVHGIPYFEDGLRTLFCEVEQILDTGDHTVVIGRILEARANPRRAGEMPLLYRDVAGRQGSHPALLRAWRTALTVSGAKERAQRYLAKRRGATVVDLAANTYREGGLTDEEIAQVLRFPEKDRGRTIAPPVPAAALSRRMGVCVVGVGAWGSQICQWMHEASPLVDLYVCGRDSRRVGRVARSAAAVDGILGLEKAVEDPRVEALVLALPHHMHREAAERAARAGKPVLVEKPIANTLADADAMIDAARRAGTILMVAENFHFRPAVHRAARAISSGAIGEPLYCQVHAGGAVSWQGWKADRTLMGGGALIDLGVHYIRAMRLLMGEPDRVFATRAMQSNTKMSGEDSAQVIYSSAYGWQAHMLFSWASPRGDAPDIIVSGDKGTLQMWPRPPYIDLFPSAPPPLAAALRYLRPAWLGARLTRPWMLRERLRFTPGDPGGYIGELREFLAAVAAQRAPATPPEDARRDLQHALAAYQAMEEERWVAIP